MSGAVMGAVLLAFVIGGTAITVLSYREHVEAAAGRENSERLAGSLKAAESRADECDAERRQMGTVLIREHQKALRATGAGCRLEFQSEPGRIMTPMGSWVNGDEPVDLESWVWPRLVCERAGMPGKSEDKR